VVRSSAAADTVDGAEAVVTRETGSSAAGASASGWVAIRVADP
jgi:hypothetical protein